MARPEPAGDTIAAIATPPGAAGIGIVRLSGPQARTILQRLFRPTRPARPLASRRLTHGWLVDPQGLPLDEVLAVFMAPPHTYTREEVVEIQGHGSRLVLEAILAAVLAAGARLALPGEFTRRAFLHGRIDLTQAEAVLDVITARTPASLGLATSQLAGRLGEAIAAVRSCLIDIAARTEVAIDFPDEDEEILDPVLVDQQLAQGVQAPLARLLAACDQGQLLREGVAVVILGRPNVGKSSLLNLLLRAERAIVTPIPGTTRDFIEESCQIRGLPVRLVDTAGIREPSEAIEAMGVERARQRMAAADLVLLVVDASTPLTAGDREIFAQASGKPLLLVANKADLPAALTEADLAAAFPAVPRAVISAQTGQGLAELEEALFRLATGSTTELDPTLMVAPNLRHKAALAGALEAVAAARAGLTHGLAPDLLAIDLASALANLADLTGETTPDDILDRIFAQFCIGK
ncbi:MAG: tRNA uridine-5-carboxymethylaminomethyl(34) synthesis GTPase MnmE [Thermodesulfobacteriota bacterium]